MKLKKKGKILAVWGINFVILESQCLRQITLDTVWSCTMCQILLKCQSMISCNPLSGPVSKVELLSPFYRRVKTQAQASVCRHEDWTNHRCRHPKSWSRRTLIEKVVWSPLRVWVKLPINGKKGEREWGEGRRVGGKMKTHGYHYFSIFSSIEI